MIDGQIDLYPPSLSEIDNDFTSQPVHAERGHPSVLANGRTASWESRRKSG